MKIGILGVGFTSVFVLTVSIIMSLGRDNTEYEQLSEIVEIVIYQSLKEGIENSKDPGDVFIYNLEVPLYGDEYTVSIWESDYEKGILSVSVQLVYKNMGKLRTVEVSRTVVVEEIM